MMDANGDRLAGRVALVTGGASGIGLAIARRFRAEGASVLVADRDTAALQRLASDLPGVATVAVDISETGSGEAMVQRAMSDFGSVDVLVNSAGICRYSPLLDLSLEEWDEVMRVNATGTFLVAQAVARCMLALPARPAPRSIVNLSSVEGHVVVASDGHPQCHYNASKGAVHMFTQALAVDLAPAIRVNSICPGITRTPLTAAALADERRTAWYLDRIPMQRFAEPDDIAAAALFLSSDDAAYITGHALTVDGGWTTA